MIKLLVVLLIVILSGCEADSKEPKVRANYEVKTHCVGRHSIGIPASFSISPTVTGIFQLPSAGAQDPVVDVVVQSEEMTKMKFKKLVHERRLELQESESETVDVLRYDTEISDELTLFRVQEIGDAYFSELYFLRGPAMIKLRLESFRNGFIEAEEKLLKLSDAIKARPSERNGEAGFCLGPVVLDADLARENVSFVFRDNSGVVIGVDLDTYGRDESLSLLGRMSRDSSILRELKVRLEVLRARERSVAGMLADEWLGVGYLGNREEERTFKFMLETKRKNPSKTTPSISLSLDSAQSLKDGTPTTTKIGNEDALELWDRMVDSIQLAKGNKI